jgi:putative transposase
VLWKRQLLEGVESVFDGPTDRKDKAADQPQTAELYEQIGKLNMQLEWLKKKWPRTVSEKRKWIDWQHP